MSSLEKILKEWKELRKAIFDFGKSNKAIWTMITAILAGGWFSLQDVKDTVDDYIRNSSTGKTLDSMVVKFDSMDVAFDKMGEGFASMEAAYKKDTARFHAAIKPIFVALDSIRPYMENVELYEEYIVDNRMFIEDLYKRQAELEK